MVCSQQSSNRVANLQNATVIVKGGTNGGAGADLEFWDNSSGGAARIKVSGNARVDVSNRSDHPFITFGSIEGNGALFLGSSVLEIGSNSLNTAFSGVIQDGGVGGGVGGSVMKAGTGRLILTNGSTYTGTTTVQGGTLLVNNRAGLGHRNGQRAGECRHFRWRRDCGGCSDLWHREQCGGVPRPWEKRSGTGDSRHSSGIDDESRRDLQGDVGQPKRRR